MKTNINFIDCIINEIKICNAFKNSFDNYKNKERKYQMKNILKEIFYILKTGLSWRQYRGPINSNSLYYYYKKLSDNRIFEKTYESIIKQYYAKNKQSKLKYQIIDTTFIRNKLGCENVSLNKYFKNKKCCKLSIITDINGIPISVLVDKGTKHDIKFVEENINKLLIVANTRRFKNTEKFKQYFLADKGYVSKELTKKLIEKNYIPIIARKRNDPNKMTIEEKAIYKKRIKIENTFSKIKQYRRLDTRYERKTSNYKSFLYFALIKICIDYMNK